MRIQNNVKSLTTLLNNDEFTSYVPIPRKGIGLVNVRVVHITSEDGTDGIYLRTLWIPLYHQRC